MKRCCLCLFTLVLLIYCIPALAETGEEMDDLALYDAAREACIYQAAYEHDSIWNLTEILCFKFDLSQPVSAVRDLIRNPDEEMQNNLTELRTAYNSLLQTATYEDVTFDIWEGHDIPPVPGTEILESDSMQVGCLTDQVGYRPVINDFRLEDPASAKATILCVPSVRAYRSEMLDFAVIFNDLGYNVLTLEPRFNKIEESNSFALLALDAQRAVRYIRYHAVDLGIDPDKIVIIGGSKGNVAHVMSIYYYDLDPVTYCETIGLTLDNYTADEIDRVPANVQVDIFNYGPMNIINSDTGELALTVSSLYEAENLPAICFLAGNNDRGVCGQLPGIIAALNAHNQNPDKLQRVNWEVHIMDGVPHGMGAAIEFSNYVQIWTEVDQFIMQNIQ